ncbi:toll/interleukin-1 receptor domain-containing protein [Thomasclavelia cocleata]|uniref:toll/interleukin-1 receptor domain-containing protein n=1 Tax=Thomasclavelia cocleata TaxID=69824 RepID=UPI00255AE774|nr:toll/interleukin-1 receptor domain-containing protein [Thomasclavelia cocleata]
MKIFISWSGSTSKKIAETLKKWLPCFIQSIEVFFSPEDIEKGDNWEYKISGELSNCKFGIICLTPDNVSAPWINFEAGAIAKSLDSRVATLMININPSDIKGPLSRYQATKIDHDDFYQLVKNINDASENHINEDILKNTFDSLWEKMLEEINAIISSSKSKTTKVKKENSDNNAIEEILQLLRKQNSILSSPENLLPLDYFEHINSRMDKSSKDYYVFFRELYDYLFNLFNRIYNSKNVFLINELDILHLIDIIYLHSPREDRRLKIRINELRRRFVSLISDEFEENLSEDNN